MTCRNRTKLAEILDLLDRHVFIAEQIMKRIKKHRAVARREDETVPIWPVGIARVDLQEAGKENGRHVRRAHGHAGMTGIGLLDRVHRQGTDRICHRIVRGTGGFLVSG